MNLKNKVAIVTGASSGIGMACAQLLTEKGAKVALVARSEKKLKKLSSKLKGSYVVLCDMSKPVEVRKMVKDAYKHFGQIDILINNAGVGYDAPLVNIDLNKFHYIFDLDVVGYVVAMQEVVPIMKKYGGSIVNVSSGTALLNLPNMSPYASLKRAIAAISLAARQELKEDGIKVYVVYPYITETAFEKNTLKDLKGAKWNFGLSRELRPPDSAEYIAKVIIDKIDGSEGEIYAHDWMRDMQHR